MNDEVAEVPVPPPSSTSTAPDMGAGPSSGPAGGDTGGARDTLNAQVIQISSTPRLVPHFLMVDMLVNPDFRDTLNAHVVHISSTAPSSLFADD